MVVGYINDYDNYRKEIEVIWFIERTTSPYNIFGQKTKLIIEKDHTWKIPKKR